MSVTALQVESLPTGGDSMRTWVESLRRLVHGARRLDVCSLSAGGARRIACDAGIIPAVLGSDGEILDWGRAVRTATPGQRRALVHRDRGCTFPGCDRPPQWCEATT